MFFYENIFHIHRRIKIQKEYNKINNIQPQTIYKSIEDIHISTAVADQSGEKYKTEDIEIDTSTIDGMESKVAMDELKRKMLQCAKNLQFEEAAILRDKIRQLEETL